jgi:apolipoprotein N-acyltransferase
MKNSTKWLLCISTGVVTALPWWGAPGILLFICFVPLMMVERSVRAEGGGVLSVLPYSFVFFLCWNLFATWWIARIHIAGGMSVIIINSAIMSMVFLLYSWIRKSTGRGGVILVILWLGFEFIHHRGDLSWPWLTLGNGLASDINLIQWYEYTGVAGGSLWVLSVNVIIFNVIRHYGISKDIRTQFMRVLVLFAAIIVPVAVSLVRVKTYAGSNREAGFLILQTNLDPYEDKYSGIGNSQRLDILLALAEENMREGVRYIVSPETSVDSFIISCPGDKMQEKVFGFLEKHPGTGFIIGATSIKPVTEAQRTIVTRIDSDGNLFDVFNSALFFFKDNPLIAYNKYYLANGVEQIPFQRILNLPQRLSIDLGGVSGSLKRGEGPGVVISPPDSLALGPLICFESAYGEYAASKVRKGAEIFILLTNDGWFKNTGAYRQHLQLARIRAVETRRSIIRSANYGISCYISPTGKVEAWLDWQEQGALFVNANTNSVKTFYASSGDFTGRTALFFSVLLILNMLVRKKITG